MKEKAAQQEGNGATSKTLPPSQSGGCASPLAHDRGAGGGKKSGKSAKKVKFGSPPKWRSKHSLSGLKSGVAKKPRQALQTLQSHASNPRLLVGSGSPRQRSIGKPVKKKEVKQGSISLQLSSDSDNSCVTLTSCDDTTTSTEKSLSDKESQTDTETSIDYLMCTSDEPPLEYWKVLAEQRREALAETLQENEALYNEVQSLKCRLTELEEQAHSGKYFAMMYKMASENDKISSS